MGFSILDAHPNNECLNIGVDEAWFSFIFCGSRIDQINLHAYDYYSGAEVENKENVTYQEIPALENKLNIWNGAGNGLRINIRDFVKDASVFDNEGEYTWRAELVQEVDLEAHKYPDNMVYEGALLGEPTVYANIDNVSGFDYSDFLPLTPDINERIKPPYYIDFLEDKYNGSAYDIPITYTEVRTKSDGTQYTAIRLTTYSSAVQDPEAIIRPSIGSRVLVHKKKNYGVSAVYSTSNPNVVFIDSEISYLDEDDLGEKNCYMKVGSEYFKILSYNKTTGAITCQDGSKIHAYPAGTHYAIYTSRFWTPYYYFRVHTMPKLAVSAEFHERRWLDKKYYDTTANCIENTTNGILFKAVLSGDSHSAVKYHYWDIYDTAEDRLVYHTEKIYSQEMDCEVFVPFGRRYTGKITVVTQDGITARGETEYYLPYSPEENNKRFSLKAIQNKFGGIELAWNYNYLYDGSSFLKATDFEVFRIEKKLNKVKYLGKVDCSPIGIEGVVPAASGSNWYLIDKDCDFKLKTPAGAKVNMYLVGGGCDGGSWTNQPNDKNKSFAVGQDGGEGGYFIKKSTVCADGSLQGKAKIAQRNDLKGTTLKIGGTIHKCNDVGSTKCGKVSSNTMTQTSGSSVIYNNDAENGTNGYTTPYGIVGSSGGGGAACGGNRTNGGVKTLSVSGITPKYNKGNWLLIDRDSLGGETGEFDLNVPEGATVRMYLVGGGCDGAKWYAQTSSGNSYSWDVNASVCEPGGGGGYVLIKELNLSGTNHLNVSIADANVTNGTVANIDGSVYHCNDTGSSKTRAVKSAASAKNQDGTTRYEPAQNGTTGVNTPYGYVGSSGGGGGSDNMKAEAMKSRNGGKGGNGAGNGGSAELKPATNGTNATNYGCGGGGGASKHYSYSVVGAIDRTEPGKGMPGCIIFEIAEIAEAPCPEPGNGGVGAGDGGFPGENGDNATNYGCGGGGAGYWAVDSDGNYTVGNVGKGMQGCIILEIELDGLTGGGAGEQVYAVDWTAASDKEYRYIVTGCNYESAYRSRHNPEEMIECTASVDITPHFEDFYLYFLNDADVLVKNEYDLENYDIPLVEPMGRYVTSRNNPYRMVKRHNHTLALERDAKAFYRRHTWRVEGDIEIGEVTHNITRNVSPLYARMPSVTVEPTDYDSFPLSFLFGYLDCEQEDGSDFTFNDQYMFELWKKCVFGKQTVMIKDPKGNVWTGVINSHNYKVEYDTNGMPYIITFDFTQTRTEYNTLVMIVDDHNDYLKTAKKNHLR